MSEIPDYPLARECPYQPSVRTAALRERGPITRVRLYDGRTTWLVTDPVEARSLLADRRLSSRADFPDYPILDERHIRMRATREMAREEEGGFAGALFGVDPPEHTRQRQMLIPSFTVRRVALHRAEIERIVEQRLDAMMRQGPPADLVSEFAAPVPMMVICAFLGVPYKDREYFEGSAWGLFDPERADQAHAELSGYLARLVAAKRRKPGTGLLDDLVSTHMASGEVASEELVQFAQAILVAGTVTSSSSIALGTLALLDTPGQYAALVANPALISGAVEEILRHVTPVEQLTRVATADIEVAGETILAGEGVLISFAASNLDPSVTSHPGQLDVTRPPHGHLAFSFGIHHCLGHNLARLELEIVFRALVGRLPNLRPAVPVEEIPAFNDGTVPRLLCFPISW